jgi:23S rRNA (uracil1939-C5)-methyltransferase
MGGDGQLSFRDAEIAIIDNRGRSRGQTDDGAPCRLRGALPGERVRASVEHVGRNGEVYGQIAGVLRASSERVPVRCPHFLACGGCDFLHASAAFQHTWKLQTVLDCLSPGPEVRVHPLVASPDAFGYRAHAKLVVGPDGTLGSYAPESHRVVDMSGCLIHLPFVEGLVEAHRAMLKAAMIASLRYILVRGALEGQVAVVTWVHRGPPSLELRSAGAAMGNRPDVGRLLLHQNDTEGNSLLGAGPDEVLVDKVRVHEVQGLLEQDLDAGAFAQVNPRAAALLYERVRDLAEPTNKRILDLYAGSGGISLALAPGSARVLGVERSAAAVAAACRTAQTMGLNQVAFRESAVEAQIEDFLANSWDVVVVNPPRSGLSPAVSVALTRISADRLVYVSCNPSSLRRDCVALADAWVMDQVIPVDLFPQTRHVETIVSFRRLPSSSGPC